MRIGVFPCLDPNGGGIYQYSLTILRALNQWPTDDELVLVRRNDEQTIPLSLDRGKWEIKSVPSKSAKNNALDRLRLIVGEGPHRDAWRLLRKKIGQIRNGYRSSSRDLDVVRARPDLRAVFAAWGLDLALYAWPTPLSFETEIPFVMAIHDLQHRMQPEFPEVSLNGEWEGREYCFRNGSRHATLVVADSEIGRQDILQCYGSYGLTEDRVKVLPFLPACYLNEDVSVTERKRIRTMHRLPQRYLFYPAQFWPHKNHLRIVQALNRLRQSRGLSIAVVFCGSHTGEIRETTFHQVMSLASKLSLENQIHYLGYVPNQDISAIYAQAAALVMPTFFGPTNIPILEAWAFGCPVLTSNIRGIREQVENAGILVDPRSVEALADGIYRLWTDEKLAASLVKAGRQRLARYTPADFRRRLTETIEEAKARIRPDLRRAM